MLLIKMTAEGPKAFGIGEIGLYPGQAKEVDLVPPASQMLEKMIKTEFVTVVRGIRNQRRENEDVQALLSFIGLRLSSLLKTKNSSQG